MQYVSSAAAHPPVRVIGAVVTSKAGNNEHAICDKMEYATVHGPPGAEQQHDAGRRCQNRLTDPELEYVAIVNNDLKSPASVDSDLPAPARAAGGGADGHSQRDQGGCTYPERASWREVPSDHETPEAFARLTSRTARRSPCSSPARSWLARLAERVACPG